jgi:hypothetical protein
MKMKKLVSVTYTETRERAVLMAMPEWMSTDVFENLVIDAIQSGAIPEECIENIDVHDFYCDLDRPNFDYNDDDLICTSALVVDFVAPKIEKSS